MRLLLYHIVKIIVKTGFFFYTKKIKIVGAENIPKNEAILFTANHPNGLIDPLIIASNIQRKTHFLVRANVFKKPTIAKLFDLMGMMPVYRIRNGFNQLKKNNAIFEKCEQLLLNKKALLIFPEGSHERVRRIRPLSKGFTRIVFGTLTKHKNLTIYIVPVGVTYQNASAYPSKVAVCFGKPILANKFFSDDDIHTSTKNLKTEVTKQLESLSVHINNDEHYSKTLEQLNKAQVDFTDVANVNSIISTKNFSKPRKAKTNYVLPLKWILILNSLLPYAIWKKAEQKIDEIEFVDTFRFGLNVILFPIFYLLQAILIGFFFEWNIGLIYFFGSLLLVVLYSKLATTNTEDVDFLT